MSHDHGLQFAFTRLWKLIGCEYFVQVSVVETHSVAHHTLLLYQTLKKKEGGGGGGGGETGKDSFNNMVTSCQMKHI